MTGEYNFDKGVTENKEGWEAESIKNDKRSMDCRPWEGVEELLKSG